MTPEMDETNKVSVIPILPLVFSSISPPKAMAPDKQAKNINAAEDKALAFKPSLKKMSLNFITCLSAYTIQDFLINILIRWKNR